MTLRERIADWISGGKLSEARSERNGYGFALEMAWADNADRQARLDRIAAQEPLGANAAVRRMARIARGEQ